jgi:hypothetical protein
MTPQAATRSADGDLQRVAEKSRPAIPGFDGVAALKWARAGALTFKLERAPLRDIESAWQRTDLRGRRLVVVP